MPWWYCILGIWLGIPALVFILWFLCQIFGPITRFRGLKKINKNQLARFVKDNNSLNKTAFLFVTRWKTEKSNYGPQGFYYDAHEAFVLRTLWGACACIAFDIYPELSRVCVRQIQGKKGTELFLSRLRWEKFLLDYATQWAHRNRFKEIWVQSSRLNKWCPKVGDDLWVEREQKKFKLRYDVTAKRMGFKFDEYSGHYIKSLT